MSLPPTGTPGVVLGYGNSQSAQHQAMTFDRRRTLFLEAIATHLGRHLLEPVGRIHWAGTETATEFPNEIEGALSAGERAADEVLAAL